MPKPKPYQPSNHTEGDIFRSRFCDQCPRDAAYRADPDSGIGCTIIADTMALNPGDKHYPKEWIYKDGEPTCTAFVTQEELDQERYMKRQKKLESVGQLRLV